LKDQGRKVKGEANAPSLEPSGYKFLPAHAQKRLKPGEGQAVVLTC
jgi:hypothetical protein